MKYYISGILLFVTAATGWFGVNYLGNKGISEIIESNKAVLALHESSFTSEFNSIENIAGVLAGSPWVLSALVSPDSSNIARANSVLDRYCSGTGASAAYLMDKNGMTIASSNRNEPDSFVGKSYAFRPYFINTLSGIPDRYMAFGTTSLKKGFYVSHPVSNNKGDIAGAAVIKLDIIWRGIDKGNSSILFFIDPNGIVFISNRPELNLKSLWPIDEETRSALKQSRQFGESSFEEILPGPVEDGSRIKYNKRSYIVSRKIINKEGWSLLVMASTEKVLIYKTLGGIFFIWIFTIIAVAILIIFLTSRSAQKLLLSENRFKGLFNTITSGVAIYTAKDEGDDFIILDINPAGERISCVNKAEITGKCITEVFPGAEELGLINVIKNVWQSGKHQFHPVSVYKDQRITQWVENNVYKLPTGEIVAVYEDVSARKKLEEEILALSFTDSLTGIHNRRGFITMASQQIKIAQRKNQRMLLFFADMDGLKWINDNLGHETGDLALGEAAAAWKGTFRNSDIVSRLGGDEFAALAIDTKSMDCRTFKTRLLKQIEIINSLPDRKYQFSISAGCSVYNPDSPLSIEELMEKADKLMYAEKQRKKNKS